MAGLARKLLLVDDDPAFVETLSEQLRQSEGFVVTTAATAKEALDKIRADYCDVVILDIWLPDMDGREACRAMRQAGIKTPIILLT
ncbi:MAG: response regulator, partial [Alphaproteobacteria bacterium]|nr:response regulator [Alphaproteobacteria bacterium]